MNTSTGWVRHVTVPDPDFDHGNFLNHMPCSVLVFQFTFSGATYISAIRAGDRGWIIVSQGTNVLTVVQAAVNAIKAVGGGMIFVGKSVVATFAAGVGTAYPLFDIDFSNVEIVGEKGHQITTTGQAMAISVHGTPSSYIGNIEIRGLNLIGDPSNDENHGAAFGCVKDSLVEGCRFKDYGDEAIGLYDCIRVDALHNYMENCGAVEGPAIELSETADSGSFDVNCSFNAIVNSQFNAIAVWQISKAKIEGNVIVNANSARVAEDGYTGGIMIYTSTRPMQDVEIINNTVRNSKFTGIRAAPYGTPAQTMSNLVIRGNKVFDNTTSGIVISGQVYQLSSNIEHNEVMRNGQCGIYYSAIKGKIHGNTCIDNPVSGTSYDNIYVYNSQDNSVESNLCIYTTSGVGRQQIYLITTSHRNSILNNVLFRPPNEVVGIRLTNDCDDNIVRNNRVNGGWYSVEVSSADCDRNEITDNVVLNRVYINDVGTSSIVKRNKGFVTENTVLSPAFAIDAVALVTVTIPHGLAVTPAIQDCSLTIVEDSNVDDWGYNLLKVDNVGAVNVVAKVNVSVASATGGATAKLSLRVGKA